MKFLGGVILSVCAFVIAFVAVPASSIDNAKQWVDNTTTNIVKVFEGNQSTESASVDTNASENKT